MFHDGISVHNSLMDTLAGYDECLGFYFGEVYNGCQLINAVGDWRTYGQEYSAKAYLDAVTEALGIAGKKVLWHEAGNTGPGAWVDNRWDRVRVGWWGFALYDSQKYLGLFDNPETKDIFVQMHEDIQYTADTANIGTVLGTWLGSKNRTRWGASIQGFWWMHTQTKEADFDLWLHKNDAGNMLDVENGPVASWYENIYDHFYILRAYPGRNPDEANWAEIPSDLTSRQMPQCLALGATVFQFEHSPYVFDDGKATFDDNFFGIDDGQGGTAGGINPVLNLVEDRILSIPAKSAVRHLAPLVLNLNQTVTSDQDPAPKYWQNEQRAISRRAESGC
jgi:hypothetical protein